MGSMGRAHDVAFRREEILVRNGAARGFRPLRIWLGTRLGRARAFKTALAGHATWRVTRSARDGLVSSYRVADGRSRALGADEPSAAITELVGGLVSEYMGHGPKARTYLNGDLIMVVLGNTLTAGEERLVRDGMSELVLSTRRAFQQTMREDLVAGVEEITGRRVRVSANDMRPNITVELLVLEGPFEGGTDRGTR
jgi:uncharacterized protein YbcI